MSIKTKLNDLLFSLCAMVTAFFTSLLIFKADSSNIWFWVTFSAIYFGLQTAYRFTTEDDK